MYDYVVKELPTLLHENFPELDTSRASIFGHSMGGHGALTIYLKNLDKYKVFLYETYISFSTQRIKLSLQLTDNICLRVRSFEILNIDALSSVSKLFKSFISIWINVNIHSIILHNLDSQYQPLLLLQIPLTVPGAWRLSQTTWVKIKLIGRYGLQVIVLHKSRNPLGVFISYWYVQVLFMQEYDATCLVSKYNNVSATILIDQVKLDLLFYPRNFLEFSLSVFFC